MARWRLWYSSVLSVVETGLVIDKDVSSNTIVGIFWRKNITVFKYIYTKQSADRPRDTGNLQPIELSASFFVIGPYSNLMRISMIIMKTITMYLSYNIPIKYQTKIQH